MIRRTSDPRGWLGARLATVLAAAALGGCLGDGGEGGGGDTSSTNPSAGVPDQDSFSIAATNLTVDQAADMVNVTNEITIKLADNLNNLIAADGTSVFFTAEGGTIPATCETVDGQCSVTWSSGSPFPTDNRVTILAWTRGSESYVDLNSNGFFDDGDNQTADLPEPFRDDNENGDRDSNELFVEFPSGVTVASGNGSDFDAADGLYSGPDCAHSSLCSGDDSIFVWRAIVIVLGTTSGGGSVTFTDCAGTTVAGPLGPGQHCAIVTADSVGNPMPDGSSISFDAGNIDVQGPASTSATNQINGTRIVFDLIADGTSDMGTLRLEVSSGGGALISGTIGTAD